MAVVAGSAAAARDDVPKVLLVSGSGAGGEGSGGGEVFEDEVVERAVVDAGDAGA